MALNSTVPKCPAPMKATSNGVFQGDNPLDFALPLAILQICLVVALTRGLAFLLRPLRQPRVIAEIVVSLLVFPLDFILLIGCISFIGFFLDHHSWLCVIVQWTMPVGIKLSILCSLFRRTFTDQCIVADDCAHTFSSFQKNYHRPDSR